MTGNTTLKERIFATYPGVKSVVVDREADINGLPATAVTVTRAHEGRVTEEVVTIAKKNHVNEDHAFAIVSSYLR